ncbi:MAG: hypothetical protein ACREUL_19990 [Steroidobacteraceae bacterium]
MTIEDSKKDQNAKMKCPFAHSQEKGEGRELGMKFPISRRDFLNGVAVTAGQAFRAINELLGRESQTAQQPAAPMSVAG